MGKRPGSRQIALISNDAAGVTKNLHAGSLGLTLLSDLGLQYSWSPFLMKQLHLHTVQFKYTLIFFSPTCTS
jgi:hypothetical protein